MDIALETNQNEIMETINNVSILAEALLSPSPYILQISPV